jgi:hypothetical protein
VYPGIEVVKVCPDPTEYHVGETINYEWRVSNTGDVPLGETIKYEWRVSNTGDVPLSSIVLTDTGGPCTPVYVSGDVNNNGKLDPGEVWIYKCSYCNCCRNS